jgi:hypothetical protein
MGIARSLELINKEKNSIIKMAKEKILREFMTKVWNRGR